MEQIKKGTVSAEGTPVSVSIGSVHEVQHAPFYNVPGGNKHTITSVPAGKKIWLTVHNLAGGSAHINIVSVGQGKEVARIFPSETLTWTEFRADGNYEIQPIGGPADGYYAYAVVDE